MSMDRESAVRTLAAEARELLDAMEAALLAMEHGGSERESLDAVFRAAHTIKGSAGLFGFDEIVAFAHEAEETLDEIRRGTIPVDDTVLSLLLACGDHLRSWMQGLETDPLAPPCEPGGGRELREGLAMLRGDCRDLVPPPPLEPRVEVVETPAGGFDEWILSFRPAPDLLQCGMDPLQIFAYLRTFCEEVRVEILDERLPRLRQADPLALHLDFELRLRTGAPRQKILDAFEFAADGSRIQLVPPHARVEEYLELLRGLPESNARLGEILVGCGALGRKELELALAEQAVRKDGHREAPPLGEMLVGQETVPPGVVEAALQRQEGLRRKGGDTRTIRVEATRLDALIDLIGELVIAGASARLAAATEKARECEATLVTLADLLERLRDTALGLRMVPIGDVFQRFPRMVRDISRELGKDVELSIAGAETELDKSMVDRIADPLTHIVRNALDHGIETTETREAAGKPGRGTIAFNAYHETGSIVIEVSDDGGGIRRDKVLARAIERGLVQSGQELSDREILELVFEPGFSTADAVSDLSGRGVGMDVVKRNIQALRGEIDLRSEPGRGTTIRLRLPLTLAIIDGFQFQVGKASFVVPLDMVKECADLSEEDLQGGIVRLREEPLPVVHLRELFAVEEPPPRRRSLVVTQHGSHRVGLVVDQLAGELQAVIKPLGPMFREVKAVGGTTILGDGSVALILDIPRLVGTGGARAAAPTLLD